MLKFISAKRLLTKKIQKSLGPTVSTRDTLYVNLTIPLKGYREICILVRCYKQNCLDSPRYHLFHCK